MLHSLVDSAETATNPKSNFVKFACKSSHSHSKPFAVAVLLISKTMKKERIKRAYANGMTDRKQLAEHFGTTEKYVAKVVREANLRPYDKRDLTISTYTEAVFLGFTSVYSLAWYFDVSERTIIRFNASTHIREKLSQYFHVFNRAALWKNEVKKPEQPTLKDVCTMLQDICSSIEPIANDNKQAAQNVKKMRQIITEIERIKHYKK